MIYKSYSHIAPVAILAVLTFTAALTTDAYEYSLDYQVKARYEYNDNVALRPDDEIDISGGKLSLPATFTMRSERMEASLLGEVVSAKYDDSGYNSDDQNVQGDINYQYERGEIDGKAGFKRDSTRTSEFLDTGVVGLDATRREEGTLGGSGHYMFTEQNGFIAGADFSDVSFDGDNYQDYEYISGYAGWLHEWSERTRLRLQGYASRYENDASLKVESDSIGAQAGFDTEFSERLSASVLAGWADVDTDYSTSLPTLLPPDDSDSTWLAEGTLDYTQERYELGARVYSGTSPSANGYLLQTTQLDLSYGYLVSEHSRLDLALIGGNSDALDSRIDNDRDYYRTRLRLDYQIAQSWYVAGTYTYSYQDRNLAGDDADSNAIYISLVFDPQKRIWSR